MNLDFTYQNPTYEKIMEGAALVRENSVDLILAVRGGSAMIVLRRFRYPHIVKVMHGHVIG